MRWYACALVVGGCHASTSTTGSPPPRVKRIDTQLVISIADEFAPSPLGCTGVTARRFEVSLDTARVGVVELPCADAIQAPARRFELPATTVTAGRHRVAVRELDGAHQAALVIDFPVLEPMDGGGFVVAEQLAIHASEEGLVIRAPRTFDKGL